MHHYLHHIIPIFVIFLEILLSKYDHYHNYSTHQELVPRQFLPLFHDLLKIDSVCSYVKKHNISTSALEQAEIQIKYSGYITKEKLMADKIQRLENILIPSNFNFNKLSSLSSEAKEKLNNIQPQTLSQANRISGIKPSDISVLIVALGR